MLPLLATLYQVGRNDSSKHPRIYATLFQIKYYHACLVLKEKLKGFLFIFTV